MTRPAIEVADILRAKGSQFLERYQVQSQLSAAEGISGHPALPYRRSRRTQGQVCRLPVRSTYLLQLLPIAMLSQVPGAGSPAMARGAATRTARHQLLPCRLHRASRTEPAGTHYAQAILRPAVRGQFPDPARGGRRSETPRRRDRIPLHPAHLEFEPARPSTMSTVSFPAADCQPTTSDGSTPAIRCSCCPFPTCAPCSATSSLPDYGSSTARTCSTAAGPAADFSDPAWFKELTAKLGKKKVVRLCQAALRRTRNMCCAISAATPIASPSPTTASQPSTASASASAGGIMPTAASSAS